MDQLAALCCAISLVIFPLVCSTNFTKDMIAESQVTNLPSSWINILTMYLNDGRRDDERIMTPILHRGSNAKQFLCGFYCHTDQTCYFSVLSFQSIDEYEYGRWKVNDLKVVWTANGGRPVKHNAILQLTQSGDMVLTDVDGTLVWSTNTGGKSVAGLNLTEMGNLVLFNRSKGAVWQSFDHPTDCLVPGQVLLQGQKLTSNISTSDLWAHDDNLSSSWINNPTMFVNGSLDDGRIMTPILHRGSNGTQFLCCFYCRNDQTCYFAVLIFQSIVDYGDGSWQVNDPKVVWTANGGRPVQYNASLQLTQSGDMVLADADGTLVWSTNTGGKSVSGLNLTEMGNLVLFNRSKAAVWQSFDHPTDCLVPGQVLLEGQKLTSSISTSDLNQGLYSLDVQLVDTFLDGQVHALLGYIKSSPLQAYYQSNLVEKPPLQFMNGSFNGMPIPPASAAQFMKLEPDGHLKVYEWGAGNYWKMVADLLTPAIGECGYPTACGRYGLCSNGECTCLDEANNDTTRFFKQTDFRQPNLGCTLSSPMSCDYSQNHSLLHLKNLTYFAFEPYLNAEPYLYSEKTDLDNCQHKCLTNCSCQAAIFLYNQQGAAKRGSCLILTEVFSVINKEESNEDIQVFVKVQIPKVPERKAVNSFQPSVMVILVSSIGGFIVICSTVACCIIIFRRKELPEEFDDFCADEIAGMPARFTYEDLKATTNNFNDKLGEGGFGSVFRGTLGNGTEVAVKRLDGLGHVKKSFLAEVGTIGSIHHINLVKLVGFCAEKSQRLLVYEYMPNGSIDKWIFHKLRDQTLGWQSRKNIIFGIAKGLAYLHEECRNKIFHLDIKPQNILLDEDFSAKVSDFGLAKLIDKDQSQVVTTMRGTPGYMAPEWLSSFITEKVDVYSFGVVVLEILCGRKNLDRSQPEEDMHLLSLFQRKAEEEQLLEIVDNYNDDMQLNGKEVVEMMRIAAWCLQTDYSRRPTMSMVVKVLEGSAEVEENLSYIFSNVGIPRAVAAEEEKHIPNGNTPLLPFSLSGPR